MPQVYYAELSFFGAELSRGNIVQSSKCLGTEWPVLIVRRPSCMFIVYPENGFVGDISEVLRYDPETNQ